MISVKGRSWSKIVVKLRLLQAPLCRTAWHSQRLLIATMSTERSHKIRRALQHHIPFQITFSNMTTLHTRRALLHHDSTQNGTILQTGDRLNKTMGNNSFRNETIDNQPAITQETGDSTFETMTKLRSLQIVPSLTCKGSYVTLLNVASIATGGKVASGQLGISTQPMRSPTEYPGLSTTTRRS